MKQKPPITPAFVPYDPTVKPQASMVAFVPRECCFQGCRRIATIAFKLSDFWLSNCDEHTGKQLSVNKALAQLPAGTFRKSGAA